MEKSAEEVIEIPCEIERSAIIERGIDAYVESLKKIAGSQVQAMHKMLFRKHSEATARVGNQIDAGGDSLSPQIYISKCWKPSRSISIPMVDLTFQPRGWLCTQTRRSMFSHS